MHIKLTNRMLELFNSQKFAWECLNCALITGKVQKLRLNSSSSRSNPGGNLTQNNRCLSYWAGIMKQCDWVLSSDIRAASTRHFLCYDMIRTTHFRQIEQLLNALRGSDRIFLSIFWIFLFILLFMILTYFNVNIKLRKWDELALI